MLIAVSFVVPAQAALEHLHATADDHHELIRRVAFLEHAPAALVRPQLRDACDPISNLGAHAAEERNLRQGGGRRTKHRPDHSPGHLGT
jgi:hypothetical protein